MDRLRVSLVQQATLWHDPEGNRGLYGEAIAPLAGVSDLVILPETFTSGFSNEAAASAETMEGPSVAWMREQARALGAALAGSLAIRDAGKVYNRLLFATPDGSIAWYDKRHLFRMAGEQERYAGGQRRVVVSWRGWRILLQVCYDLRFPVFMRNRGDYDLILVVANWPSARREHWRVLLRARAIENLACLAAVNRVGRDGNGLEYAGDSALIDAQGRTLLELGPEPAVATLTLDPEPLRAWRERFPADRDADRFALLPE
ncbi:MAG: amidohydrolase [Xanthomonadales bacterium]|nr:amidohydrolase [Xanthomonadales bacterium]